MPSSNPDVPDSLKSVLGERGALAQMLAHGVPHKSWSTTFGSSTRVSPLKSSRRPILSSSSPGLYSHASHMGHFPFSDPQRDVMSSILHGEGCGPSTATGGEEEGEEEAIPIGKPISKIRPQRNGRSRAERALEAELYAEAGRVAAAQAAAAAARRASMGRAPPSSAYAPLSTTARRTKGVVVAPHTSTTTFSSSSFTAGVPTTSSPVAPPQPPPVKFKSVAFEVTLGGAPATSTTTSSSSSSSNPAPSPTRPAPHKANPAFFNSSSALPVTIPERTLLPSSTLPPPSSKSSISTTFSPPSQPPPPSSAFDLAAGVLAEEAMAVALGELTGEGGVEMGSEGGAATRSSFVYPSPPLPASPPLDEGEGDGGSEGEGGGKDEMGEGDSLGYEPPTLSEGAPPLHTQNQWQHQQQQQHQQQHQHQHQPSFNATTTFPPPPPLPSRAVWKPTSSAQPSSTLSTTWEQAASYRSSFSHTEGAITMIRGVPPNTSSSSSSSSSSSFSASTASPSRSSTLIATLPGGGKSRVGLSSSNPYQPPLDWHSNLRRDDPSLDVTLHSNATSVDHGGGGGRRGTSNYPSSSSSSSSSSSVSFLGSQPPPTTSSSTLVTQGRGSSSSPPTATALDSHLTAVPKGGTPAYLKSIKSVIGEKVRADRVAAASQSGSGGEGVEVVHILGGKGVGGHHPPPAPAPFEPFSGPLATPSSLLSTTHLPPLGRSRTHPETALEVLPLNQRTTYAGLPAVDPKVLAAATRVQWEERRRSKGGLSVAWIPGVDVDNSLETLDSSSISLPLPPPPPQTTGHSAAVPPSSPTRAGYSHSHSTTSTTSPSRLDSTYSSRVALEASVEKLIAVTKAISSGSPPPRSQVQDHQGTPDPMAATSITSPATTHAASPPPPPPPPSSPPQPKIEEAVAPAPPASPALSPEPALALASSPAPASSPAAAASSPAAAAAEAPLEATSLPALAPQSAPLKASSPPTRRSAQVGEGVSSGEPPPELRGDDATLGVGLQRMLLPEEGELD